MFLSILDCARHKKQATVFQIILALFVRTYTVLHSTEVPGTRILSSLKVSLRVTASAKSATPRYFISFKLTYQIGNNR